MKEVKASVEKGYLTPLDGARLISSITAYASSATTSSSLREISPTRRGSPRRPGAAPVTPRREREEQRSSPRPTRLFRSWSLRTARPADPACSIFATGGKPAVSGLPRRAARAARQRSYGSSPAQGRRGYAQPLATTVSCATRTRPPCAGPSELRDSNRAYAHQRRPSTWPDRALAVAGDGSVWCCTGGRSELC